MGLTRFCKTEGFYINAIYAHLLLIDHYALSSSFSNVCMA